MTQQTNLRVSRRSFVKGAVGIGGGIAMASFAGALGVSAAEGDDDRTTRMQRSPAPRNNA
jgi:hypothetical protein